MKMRISSVVFALASLTSFAALAAEAPSAGTTNPGAPGIAAIAGNSTVNGTAGPSSALSNFGFSYFGNFHGGTLHALDSSYTVDRNGKLSKAYGINFDSSVTAAYMFSPSIGLGPEVPFLLVPVRGKGFILGDVGLKAFNKKTVTDGGFTLATNLSIQAPTSDASQARHMSFAVKTTPSARYAFSHSRFGVGTFTEAKAYIGVIRDKTFKLWAAPYVNYQLSPKISANLLYEMEAHHDVGQAGVGFNNYQTDLQPGIVWIVTPQVFVNPYVQIFTGSRIAADRMAVGTVISASLM